MVAKTVVAASVVAVVAVIVIGSGFSASRRAALPAGLAVYGRLVWNFEGLLQRRLGTAHACQATTVSGPTQNWTRTACRRALAFQLAWQPVFAPHSETTFSATTAAPPALGNVLPIRIAGAYVRCSSTRWLVELSSGRWSCMEG
jgi:hypothetical protein